MNPRLLRPRATGYVAPDADARAYLAAVRTADGSNLEPAVAKAINDFVAGCKTDGIWTAIKASCILMGARTLSGALTPLVGTAPTNVNFVSGDYNRKTGLVGDGSTKYLNSGRNNNADPQNSVSHAVWVSTATATNNVPIGAGFNLTGATRCAITASPATTSVRIRNSSISTPSPLVVPSSGTLFAYRRSASNATLIRINGSDTAYTTASETPFNGNVFVYADNNSGSATAFSASRLGFYSIGESLDLALLDTRVSALYTAIGAALAPNYADADVNAYINAVETADGQLLETGVRDAINTFITGCKSDGTWTAIKASCILMGARTLSGALTPLVGSAPTNNGPFVSGDYNRKTGLVGNGSTKYLNSNYAFGTALQDNRHAAVWVSTAQTSGAHAYLGSASLPGETASRSQIIGISGTETSISTRLSNETTSTSGTANNVAGLIGVTRSGSASYVRRAAGADATVTAASMSGDENNMLIFARNVTTFFNHTSGRLAFYSIGESLTLSLLDSRVSTLYTAIGAAIP
jgi:hypothetical protein